MSPKVSVIVPNYNHAPYLRQRLDSIFNQTFQDFEVIILDDCSTDNSKEIIEQYQSNPKVSHIVYNETNSGSPFKQWAKGFDLAQGEFIWIAESDDWAEQTFLQVLSSQMGNDVSFAFCNSFMTTDAQKNILHPDLKSFRLNGKTFIRKYLSFENIPYNASSILFRRKNLSNINLDFQNFKSAGDWLFWIYNSTLGDVIFENKPLNYCRLHEHNTTQKNMKNGVLLEENLIIFHYLKKEKLFNSRLNRQLAILLQLDCFFKDYLKNSTKAKMLLNKWNRERYPFSRSFCFLYFFFKKILSSNSRWQSVKEEYYCISRHFYNINLIQILWVLLHLPQTDLRKKLKHIIRK